MLYKVEGIVIRCMDYGEGNIILTLYTKPYGRVSVMARGAKKTKSRFSAITQLFTYAEFNYYKTGSMGNLNQGEILDAHRHLRENLHMTAFSAYLAEMVDRFSYVEDESTLILFEQLKAGLSAIEEGKDPQIIVHVFEMRILELSGYSPSLHECVSCTTPTNHEYISSALGGVLCASCLFKDSKAINISAGTLKLLRLFQRMDIRRMGTIEVKDETRSQLKQCIRELMDRHIGIEWRSRNFLDQMDKYGI